MKRLTLCLLALSTLSLAPASAADTYTQEDRMAMQDCIEAVNGIRNGSATTDEADMSNCINAASGLCQEKPEGQTTSGVARCNQREAAWWDEYLNSMYDQLEEALDPQVLSSLEKAHRAWLSYRDAKCDFSYQLSEGGSMGQQFLSYCLLDETGRRAIDLARAVDNQG